LIEQAAYEKKKVELQASQEALAGAQEEVSARAVWCVSLQGRGVVKAGDAAP
jgi:hypothetical protein